MPMGPLQVIVDDDPQCRRRVRYRREGFAHDVPRIDGLTRRETMIARQDDDEAPS